MSTPFAFTLSESSALAKKALSAKTDARLSCWHTVYANYLSAKRRLIDALDSDTGRRVEDFTRVPTPCESRRAFAQALGEVEYAARADGAADHIASALFAFRNRFGESDVAQNAIDKSSALLDGFFPGIKAGMRLTRALNSALEQYDRAANGTANVNAIVSDILRRAEIAPRVGKLVLSANIADILLCSEHAAYTSCHGLEGCHRAGPQQYLADSFTVVAYYYEELRPYYREQLPYKLMRQVIHLDRERHSAALMRMYPAEFPKEMQQAIRRMVARLLCRLRDGTAPDEPRWIHAATELPTPRHVGEALAYVDACSSVIQLEGGSEFRPRVKLVADVPCGSCDDNSLDDCNSLVCSACGEDDRIVCHGCDGRLHEDDTQYHVDDNTYCESCYADRFFGCHRCGEDFTRDEAHEANGDQYCQSCFDRQFIRCEACDEPVRRNDAYNLTRCDGSDEGNYCESCYNDVTSTCDVCDEQRHTDDIDRNCAGADGVDECVSCGETRVKALYARLSLSPAWRRGDVFDRASLRRRFSDASRIQWLVDDSAVWTLHDAAPAAVVASVAHLCAHAG